MKWEIEVRNEGQVFYTEVRKSPEEAEKRAKSLKQALQSVMKEADISVVITSLDPMID